MSSLEEIGSKLEKDKNFHLYQHIEADITLTEMARNFPKAASEIFIDGLRKEYESGMEIYRMSIESISGYLE